MGGARARYKVAAPATTGHPDFERTFRVHYNTLELLVAFIPSIWLFGLYLNPRWGAIIGAVFLVGRALYARRLHPRAGKTRTRRHALLCRGGGCCCSARCSG